MSKQELRKQLKKTGANQHEADSLADIASALGSIKTKGLSDKTKQEIFENIGKKPRIVYPLRWATGGLVAAMLIIVISTVVINPKPSSVEINREDDQTEEVVNEVEQEEQMIIEQMQEVETLKQEKAPEQEIKDAEDRYEHSVRDYWQRSGNDENEDYWDWWQNRYQQLDSSVNSWSDRPQRNRNPLNN